MTRGIYLGDYFLAGEGEVGPPGPEGPEGPQGAQGPRGFPGEQGPGGDAATVDAEDTITLPPEQPADVVNVGSTSEALFRFFIPQGAQGDIGPVGPEGPQGPGFTVVGSGTVAEINALVPGDLTSGDAYQVLDTGTITVGTQPVDVEPNDLIVWTEEGYFINLGTVRPIEIPPGSEIGAVIKWDGAAWGQTTALVIDNNDNVGIGVLDPADKLHVRESASGAADATGASVAMFERAGNAGITIATEDTGAASLFFGDGASSTVGRVVYDHATDSLALWANSAARLTVIANGNVGVGTAAPIEKLDVANGVIRIPNNTTPISETDNSTYFGKLGGSAFMSGPTAAIRTSGAERVRIDSAGNVGIGTDSPNQKLVLAGGGAAELQFAPFTTSGYLYARDAAGATRFAMNYDALDHSFRAGDGSIRMLINSAGAVGVGEPDPQSLLDVRGLVGGRSEMARFTSGPNAAALHITPYAASANNRVYLSFNSYRDDTTAFQYDNENIGSSYLNFNDGFMAFGVDAANAGTPVAPTEHMRLTAGGNLGVGTNDPSTRFHAYRDDGVIVSVIESGVSGASLNFVDTNSTAVTANRVQVEGDDMLVYAGGSERVRIDGDGLQLRSANATDQGSVLSFRATQGGAFGQISARRSSNSATANTGLVFSVTNDWSGEPLTPAMQIQSTGRIACGTTSTEQTLYIDAGRGGNSNAIWSNSATTPFQIGIFNATNSSNFDLISAGTGNVRMLTQGAERMRIHGGGRVTIGTTSASRQLGVQSADNEPARFTSTNTSGYSLVEFTNTNFAGGNGAIGVLQQDMVFRQSGAERMRIASDGGVLVGANTGSQGQGTINVTTGYFVNGTPVVLKSDFDALLARVEALEA